MKKTITAILCLVLALVPTIVTAESPVNAAAQEFFDYLRAILSEEPYNRSDLADKMTLVAGDNDSCEIMLEEKLTCSITLDASRQHIVKAWLMLLSSDYYDGYIDSTIALVQTFKQDMTNIEIFNVLYRAGFCDLEKIENGEMLTGICYFDDLRLDFSFASLLGYGLTSLVIENK